MRKAVRRLAATTGVLVAAGVLPIVATAPAHADTTQCASYLANLGYKIGPGVRDACEMVGDAQGPIAKTAAWPICITELSSLGVKGDDAGVACHRG